MASSYCVRGQTSRWAFTITIHDQPLIHYGLPALHHGLLGWILEDIFLILCVPYKPAGANALWRPNGPQSCISAMFCFLILLPTTCNLILCFLPVSIAVPSLIRCSPANFLFSLSLASDKHKCATLCTFLWIQQWWASWIQIHFWAAEKWLEFKKISGDNNRGKWGARVTVPLQLEGKRCPVSA